MTRRKRMLERPADQRRGGTLPSLVASYLRTPMLTGLPPREQEVATIVYLNTCVTAKELESALSDNISNSAIRCMLSRLIKKGVLRRRMMNRKTFVYEPVLLLPEVQERALERAVDEYFSGSLRDAMSMLLGIARRREPVCAAHFLIDLENESRSPSGRRGSGSSLALSA